MSDQDQEIIKEFLVESYENLQRLDQELLQLERDPHATVVLASVFRTIHTIKGTCGFLGFSALERLTHHAENLLSHLREGKLKPTPALTSLLLRTVDATRTILASIEATGAEGPDDFGELNDRLREAVTGVQPSNSTGVPAVTRPGAETTMNNAEEPARNSTLSDANIRVGVSLLDRLMDLVGELVLTRNQILQFNNQSEDATLGAASQRLDLITSELQEGVMKTRMQPIGVVWNKLPRVVRDTATALGKKIRVEMDGAETELDRTIIEAIRDPLVHLVRNACDHGIEAPDLRLRAGKAEQGKLLFRAYHEGGQVNIEISDDGAGVDLDRVKQKAIERGLLRREQADGLTDREVLGFLFHPGLSTASNVTNVSGRGVGMDVVKSHIEKIGGVVDVFSRSGQGTTVKLKIPLTLAIIPGLVVTCAEERFVIPQVSLLDLIRLDGESKDQKVEHVHGTPVYRRRGTLLPIAYLNQVLGLPPQPVGQSSNIVVLQVENRQFGLVVDGISDTQDIVVKPVGSQLKGLTLYAGATIMGDGRVALILDVLGIGQRSGVLRETHEVAAKAADTAALDAHQRQLLLTFRAGSFEHLAVPLSLVSRLEEFGRSAVEHACGHTVVQYRGNILPLVSLREFLEPERHQPELPEVLPVMVFNFDDQAIGIVVDQIIDVIEDTVTARQRSDRKGLLGSAVVGKRVTDFLDLNAVLRHVSEQSAPVTASVGARRVLVVDASAASRSLIRSTLDMGGYATLEAADLHAALQALRLHRIDVVLAAVNLPPDGASALLSAMQKDEDWARIPVVALTDVGQQTNGSRDRIAGFREWQSKLDAPAMLESVRRLATALDAAELTVCGA